VELNESFSLDGTTCNNSRRRNGLVLAPSQQQSRRTLLRRVKLTRNQTRLVRATVVAIVARTDYTMQSSPWRVAATIALCIQLYQQPNMLSL